MTCPQFSREHNGCLLLQEAPRDDEERALVPVEETVSRALCLAPRNGYRDCPVFRRFLAELASRVL
jgi:hypothetical protein